VVNKTIRSVVTEIRARFASAGLDTPALDARLLVQSVLGMSHEELLLNPDRPVSDTDHKKLKESLRRRLRREPVSRILGRRFFWRSEFQVSPDTLDPRADSETLIEAVLKHFPLFGTAPSPQREMKLRILDLGTGTGCLLLSLLQELPQATGTGIDISGGAIQIARQNAGALDLAQRSVFIISDWSTAKIDATFDVVISNPPYIPEAEIAGLEPEVSQYEPHSALAGGVDGLECYRSIASLLPRLLKKDGKVFLEIGHDQADFVKEILARRGFSVLQTVPDIAGHDRCIVAQWSGSR